MAGTHYMIITAVWAMLSVQAVQSADRAALDDDLALLKISAIRTDDTTYLPAMGQELDMDVMSPPAGVLGGTSLLALFESVERHMPLVEVARADLAAQRAAILTATAPFDLRLKVDYYGRATGFYGGQNVNTSLAKRLENYGAEVYGGYRIGNGGDRAFPIYEDVFRTNGFGELKAGARVSLLRGRETDKFRTDLQNARITGRKAIEDYRASVLSIKADAAEAYLEWLYWVRVERVYANLLKIAQARQVAVQKSVDAGQLPAIALSENQQLITGRQATLLDVQQSLLSARMALSLFLRDQQGQVIDPIFGRGAGFADLRPFAARQPGEWSDYVFDQRPDIQALRLENQRLRNKLALAENDLQPDLELGYEISGDFGDGSPSREGVDNILSLNFNVPLAFSAARGAEARAKAELTGLSARLRLIEDQVGLGLEMIRRALVAARDQIRVGEENVHLTAKLRVAEEQRFLAGNSNFFQLNAQETQLANSQLVLIDAERNRDVALVRFYRVTGAVLDAASSSE